MPETVIRGHVGGRWVSETDEVAWYVTKLTFLIQTIILKNGGNVIDRALVVRRWYWEIDNRNGKPKHRIKLSKRKMHKNTLRVIEAWNCMNVLTTK